MEKSTLAIIEDIQLHQFRRLLDTKRLKFEDAYYVIFSDYPTIHSLAVLIEAAQRVMPNDISFQDKMIKVANQYIRQ